KRSHPHRLLDRVGMHRVDLPVDVAQEVAPDPTCPDFRTLRRWLISDGIEIGRAPQHVVVLDLIHREVFRTSLQRSIAAGAEKTGHLKQSRKMLLIVPTIELGLV